MVNIPEAAMEILNDPKAVKVVATKVEDGGGGVHAIIVGSVAAPNKNTIIFGAVLMKRTGKNLESMKKSKELVSVLVNKEMKAYEIKALVKDYLTSGPIFEGMNVEMKKMGLAARGVWVLEPKEVWNQSATYEAGTKIA